MATVHAVTVCVKRMRKDKEATRKYHREWYQKNKARRRAQIDANRERIKALYREYKATLSCTICGENSSCCLDFHHVDENKEDNISSLVHRAFNWEKILEEISKCVVLCKNCHTKVHAGLARVV